MQQKPKNGHFKLYDFHGKPYNFFGDYLREKYGFRLFKLPVNANLGCPNRSAGRPCIFCSESGSASPSATTPDDIHKQMLRARESFVRTDVKTKYIAYFQAYTNTYSDVDTLKSMYDQAVNFPDVQGLMIGTRPDCLNEETVQLISSYKNDDFELWVEIGMQSCHNNSLDYLHRCHTHEDTVASLKLLDNYGISSCVHIILGIPGESWVDMMTTANMLSSLPVNGVKIHHLHVLKKTELEKLYHKGEVPLLSISRYSSLICDFLERIPPDILVHRLSGDALEDQIIAPRWGLEKGTVQKTIEQEFYRRGSWQGFLCERF